VLSTLAFAAPFAHATSIVLDLDEGTLSDGLYTSPEFEINIPLNDNSLTGEVWIDFVDRETEANQHIEIVDTFSPGRLEQVLVTLGSDTRGMADVGIILSGVMGSSQFFPIDNDGNMDIGTYDTECHANEACDPITSADFTDRDDQLFIHDIHFDFETTDPPWGFAFTSLQFSITGDVVNQGVWSDVPEPTALALMGLGLTMLGMVRRRQAGAPSTHAPPRCIADTPFRQVLPPTRRPPS